MKSPLFVSRREFMQKSGRLVSTIGAAAAFAPFGSINARAQAGPDYKAMVCIFLFGGNDANNTVVPRDRNMPRIRASVRAWRFRRHPCWPSETRATRPMACIRR